MMHKMANDVLVALLPARSSIGDCTRSRLQLFRPARLVRDTRGTLNKQECFHREEAERGAKAFSPRKPPLAARRKASISVARSDLSRGTSGSGALFRDVL